MVEISELHKNGFYNILGTILRFGCSIVTIPLLLKFSGVETFGYWAIVSATIALMALADLGLSFSTTIFLSRNLAHKSRVDFVETLTTAFLAISVLALCVGTAMMVAARPISSFLFLKGVPQNDLALYAIRIGAIVGASQLPTQLAVGVLQSLKAYKFINILSVSQVVLTNIGLLLIAQRGGNVIKLLEWQAVIGITSLGCHLFVVHFLVKNLCLPISWKWHPRMLKKLIKHGVYMWCSSLGTTSFSQADRIVVGLILGPAAAGIYSAIATVASQINVLSSAAVQPMLPEIARLFHSQGSEHRNISMILKNAFLINVGIAMLIGAGLFLLAPQVLAFVLPQLHRDNYILSFRLAICIYTIISFNAVGYYFHLAIGNVAFCGMIVFGAGLGSLLMVGVGSYVLGFEGAVIGNSVYILTLTLTCVAFSKANNLGFENLQVKDL